MDRYPLVVQGDAEGALVDILMNAPELTGFAGGAPTISTTLDEYKIGDRWITVSAEGGSGKFPKIAKPRVDFNVFAERRVPAHDMAQLALGILFREMGQPMGDFGVRMHRIVVETGLVRADDKLTDAARYVFALRIHLVPYNP